MTFRSRVIATAAVVAVLAVFFAASASYVLTRNSLLRAVDQSLIHQAQSTLRQQGDFDAIVLPNGQEFGYQPFPVDSLILQYAKGKAGDGFTLRTINFNSQPFRELITSVPTTDDVPCGNADNCHYAHSAGLLLANISGQEGELQQLAKTLLLVGAGVMLLALGLGIALARTALHPLEQVTEEIEDIALTSDVSRRLEPGGDDELGRLRTTFNTLLDTIDASQHLQRQLVLDASHELRTPLTSLRTNAQVLSQSSRLTPEDIDQVTFDMVAQVDELASLVTDLAELARGERSEGPVVELRLDEVVDEAADIARTYARTKNIQVSLDLQASSIMGRRDRLERAVSNLLTNAIKFTPHGGTIRVRSFAGSVIVADSGPGVNPDDIPFIFNRFWRSPSARGLPGSGLGLSIVDQVVNECNGTLKVDRDPDLGGARFTMTFHVVGGAGKS